MKIPISQSGFAPTGPGSLADGESIVSSQNVKYDRRAHIVTRRHLLEALQPYREAAKEVEAWVSVVDSVRWHNFAELRSTFRDADYVNGDVIFNIRRNRYR